MSDVSQQFVEKYVMLPTFNDTCIYNLDRSHEMKIR
jgi:hypothetical protein